MRPRMFDETVLPHLDAAFNYARWLTRNDADAEDVVQDACVRAVRFFASPRDGQPRSSLFPLARNKWDRRPAGLGVPGSARSSGMRGTAARRDAAAGRRRR